MNITNSTDSSNPYSDILAPAERPNNHRRNHQSNSTDQPTVMGNDRVLPYSQGN